MTPRRRFGWHADLPTCPDCGNQSGTIEHVHVGGKHYTRKHCAKCSHIYDSDVPKDVVDRINNGEATWMGFVD
jgi:rubredoxin